MECLSVSSTSDGTTTYSTTEEEVLSVVSESEFKSSNSQLDLLSQGEAADPFAPIVYAEKIHPRIEPANRTGMEVVKLVTNIFPIRTDPNREVYRYDVSADLVTGVETRNRNGGVISMNRGPKDDTLMTRRSEAVRAALKAALEAYRILSETGVTVFDGTTILFSNEDLAMALKPHNGTLTLPEKQRKFESRFALALIQLITSLLEMRKRRLPTEKGIRFIEGAEYKETTPDARLVAALVLDAKIGTFYKANGLVETIAQLNRWEGVHQVQWDPAAIKRTNTYLRGLQKARKPDDRWNLIKNHLDELDLSRNSPIMAGFGISVDSKPLQVTGFRRPAPKVQYGESRSVPTDLKKAGWKQGKETYTEGAVVDKLYIAWNENPRVLPQIQAFVERFKIEADHKGITIRSLEVENAPTNLDDEVRTGNLFAKAKNQRKILGAKATIMIIYISNKFVDPAGRIPETRSHGLLKFLEAKHQIVTQHLATDTILGKKQYDNSIKPMDNATMENILNKFNLKAFGLNYTIVPESFAKDHWFGSTLIMGYDVCHPTGQTVGERALGFAVENPSVVGFAHNGCENRDAFVGDFAFQEPLRERVDDRLLNARTKWMLKWWQKRRDPKLPENFFIFRDGVSEGQYEMVLSQELGAIQEACDEYEVGYKPNFLLVVVTKRHNKRFFKEGSNGAIGNPEALTVVDQEIVRTDLTELFIQSHHAIQGTAKATQYVLLYSSDPSITQDTLQPLILALTFQHQICNMPVSIPEPVYQSDEWAKRGSELLKTYRDLKFPLARKNGGDGRDKRQPIDWEEMTKRLGYMNKPLDGVRANA
ncbi:unnamed protein product, partial [Mesorhabditis belari]|uniref:Piwi domain-containing protein n=1 Tax=Mesorhabditis belari TaxID=2138241 RepID=A0AAF3EJ59_9BILA